MTNPKLQQLDPILVEKMANLLPRQSPEEVQNRFGIGINTWMKLRKGEAIRHSVAERLVERIQGMLTQ